MSGPAPGPGPNGARWAGWVAAELEGIRAAGRWRHLQALSGVGPRVVDGAGRELVSFASNDYLGLASHPAVIDAAVSAARQLGTGSGSSRLIVGDREMHHDLEAALASWRGQEAAVVLPSGYHANLAVLTVLGSAPGCRIVSDELNHASIIDGARLSRAEVRVYRHGDAAHAVRLISEAAGPVVVVSDTVFSMDGDLAPVEELSAACAASGAALVLDDAHAVLAVPAPDPAALCIRVGTLSKALGAQGGYVAGPAEWIDLIVNRGRSFIFTTGLSPVVVAAARSALAVVASDEGRTRVARLRAHVDAVAPGHPSPILPVMFGSEEAALRAADRLRRDGLLVPAIRPPTVPAGTSRLRVSLSAAHEEPDVARLRRALAAIRQPATTS